MARSTRRIKPRLKNYIAIVLDSSTSIESNRLTQHLRNAFNSIKATLKKKSALSNQDTYVTLITFNETVNPPLFKHANVNMIPDLDYSNYNPSGGTSLFDAVAKAIEIFDNVPIDDDTSFVVYPITDGEERNSVFTSANDLRRMITNREDKGNWTFAFQVPKGYHERFCRQFGVSEDNVSEWEQSEVGTQHMEEKTSSGINKYFDDRAAGNKMSKTFFSVTPDLSDVKVSKQLDDIAYKFRSFTVPAESVIRNFVEDKTGKDYIPGSAFYQLVKPEKVQPSKQVVIQEKGTGRTKKIYGGQDARSLIGLPSEGHARVTPGNHDNYDIFIQSKSVNRILPRGSKLLVEKDI